MSPDRVKMYADRVPIDIGILSAYNGADRITIGHNEFIVTLSVGLREDSVVHRNSSFERSGVDYNTTDHGRLTMSYDGLKREALRWLYVFARSRKGARCSTIEPEKKKQFVIVGAVCRLMPTNTDGPWKSNDVTRWSYVSSRCHHDVFTMFPDTSNRGRSGSPSG